MQPNTNTPKGLRLDSAWRVIPSPSQSSLSWVVIWLGIALFSYRHVIGDLFNQWQTNPSYSHGAVVLPLAIGLLWLRRSTLPKVQQPWSLALGLLVAAHGLLWVGEFYHLPAVKRWTIPLWICGATGLMFGRPILIWSLPGICFLGFMIPMPFQMENLASQFLQSASACCSCYLLSLTSTFAVTDGYTLRLDTGELGITKDCSGLRMTVAIAAIGYAMTFINSPRTSCGSCNLKALQNVAIEILLMVIIAIPAAIGANALRIMMMALVMDHYHTSTYTNLAHDLGEWLVLPIAAFLFFTLRAWLEGIRSFWREAKSLERSKHGVLDRAILSRLGWNHFAVRILALPAALVVLASTSALLYEQQRKQITDETTSVARKYEGESKWDQAASCYRSLTYLQPRELEPLYRYAWVSLQAADTMELKKQAYFKLESVLAKAPFHAAALHSKLLLSLDLNLEAEAADCARRLHSFDSNEASSQRLCLEAMLRFREGAIWPPDNREAFFSLLEQLGPVSQWRDRLVVELASYCCNRSDSMDHRVIDLIAPVITLAADHVGTAQAYFVAWQFDQEHGNGTLALDEVRLRIDEECPSAVVYEIYVSSAEVALRRNRLEDAKQHLLSAISCQPGKATAFALLGEVAGKQDDWEQSTAAYLRAWRLANDRPAELGISLAEALIRTKNYDESSVLMTQLKQGGGNGAGLASRVLRIRLTLCETRLAIRAEKYEDALKMLRRCQWLATINDWQFEESKKWLPSIESLTAQCLVRLGRYAEVARLFERRAVGSDTAADDWTAAARAWVKAGDAFSAEWCYRMVFSKAGYDTEVWLEYVRWLQDHSGTRFATEEVVRQQRQSHEDSKISDIILAQAWEIVGNSDLAIRHYQFAAEHDTHNRAALAIALARHGKTESSVALVSDPKWLASPSLRAHTAAVIGVEAANLSSTAQSTLDSVIRQGGMAACNDASLLLATVEWYLLRQQSEPAIELLRDAVKLQPGNLVAGNNLAMLLADEARDFEEALAQIDDILNQAGTVTEFLDTKGWILVQMDRAEEALPWLTLAVERAGIATPTLQLHLATAYLAVGNRDRAREYVELAHAAQLDLEHLNRSEKLAWQKLQLEFLRPKKISKRPLKHRDS